MEIKTKVNKWDLKAFAPIFLIDKIKKQPTEWEKIIANETTDS